MEIRRKEGRGRRKEEEIKTRPAAPPSIDGWRWRGHMPEAESWLSFFLFLLLPRLFFFFFLIPLHKAGAQPLHKSGDQEFDLFFSSFYPFRLRCYGHSSINQCGGVGLCNDDDNKNRRMGLGNCCKHCPGDCHRARRPTGNLCHSTDSHPSITDNIHHHHFIIIITIE